MLSVFKPVFVLILTYAHESWATTERVRSQVQVAEMGLLRRAHGVTLRDIVRSCEIREVPECRATSPNKTVLATLVRPCVQNVPETIGGASSAGYTHR